MSVMSKSVSGLGSVASLAGDCVQARADGTYAVSAVSGESSAAESSGLLSASVASGHSCLSSSRGDGSLAASAGPCARSDADGDNAVALSAGDGARASGSGGVYAGHAVAVAVGKDVAVRGKRGTFLYAVEMSGYPVAACGYVDGRIVKEDVWYVAGNDGHLHEKRGEEENA